MLMRRAGRTVIATLLCGSLAALTASSTALAQNRANSSGLPSASGNPLVQLQQQIDALAAAGQDVSALRQRLATLEQQVSALSSLQGQINTLSTQIQTLGSQIGSGGGAKLAVYDHNEQKMGDVVGVQDNVPWVGLTAGNRSFVLQVFPEQMVGQILWFDGSNCTGRVFIAGFTLDSGPNVFALAAVQEPGGVVYAADANTPPVVVPLASFLDSSGRCLTWATTQRVLPASAVMRLDAQFQRPYTVR